MANECESALCELPLTGDVMRVSNGVMHLDKFEPRREYFYHTECYYTEMTRSYGDT